MAKVNREEFNNQCQKVEEPVNHDNSLLRMTAGGGVPSEEKCAIFERNLEKKLACSIDEKMKEFVEKVYKIEKETTLSNYYLKHLMNNAPKDPDFKKFRENPHKNRNPDVFCLEATRVRLKNSAGGSGCDYIHANYITIDNTKKAYIATQHPMPSTTVDFWNMVYNENIEVIVSLTSLVGPDFPTYHPTHRHSYSNYGAYQIICKSIKQGVHRYGPLIYTLEVVPQDGGTGQIVQLIKYSSWGKNHVPIKTKVIMQLLRFMNKMKSFAPILIQCETGINQSAVLIYVDALFHHLQESRTADVEAVFQNIRKQRVAMMPQKTHFVYSIYTVLDMIKMRFHHANSNPDVVEKIESLEKSLRPVFSKYITVEAHDNRTLSPTATDLFF